MNTLIHADHVLAVGTRVDSVLEGVDAERNQAAADPASVTQNTVRNCLNFEEEASNRTETDQTGAVRQGKLKVNKLEQNAPSCRAKLTMLEQNSQRLG